MDAEASKPASTLDAGALIRAADKARRSWDRDDVIDYAHAIAHYLHTDDGVTITVAGKPIYPAAMSLNAWRRLVRDNDLGPID